MAVAPLDQARLAALVKTGSPAMAFDRLDKRSEYADVIAASAASVSSQPVCCRSRRRWARWG